MKRRNDGGFSLIEVLVAMVVLALIVVPTCSSLVLSYRLNAKAEQMLQAQLAVSSAVETLMASGIDATLAQDTSDHTYDTVTDAAKKVVTDYFPEVTIVVSKNSTTDPYYSVTVKDNNELVEVTTTIRVKSSVSTVSTGGGNS